MARCVVLGGGGFIGANLVARLLADGHQVKCVDVQFPAYRQPAILDATLRVLDLTDPANAQRALHDAEWVFHLAADMGGVGYFHGPADLGAALTNGRITNNVLHAALRAETPRLFYAASACAYPTELMTAGGRVLLNESQVGRGTPDALYGAEKLQGLRYCSKVPGARVGILDTVYGPLQEHSGRRMKFPAAVATKALAARQSRTLELWGDGSQRRCYLYVDDAVERIVRIMEADHYAGPVNIGASGAVSCIEVARMCLELVGTEAVIVTNPDEPSGVLSRECDHSEFERRYGKVEDATLREGFARFIDWLDAQPTTATRTPPRNAMAPKPTVR